MKKGLVVLLLSAVCLTGCRDKDGEAINSVTTQDEVSGAEVSEIGGSCEVPDGMTVIEVDGNRFVAEEGSTEPYRDEAGRSGVLNTKDIHPEMIPEALTYDEVYDGELSDEPGIEVLEVVDSACGLGSHTYLLKIANTSNKAFIAGFKGVVLDSAGEVVGLPYDKQAVQYVVFSKPGEVRYIDATVICDGKCVEATDTRSLEITLDGVEYLSDNADYSDSVGVEMSMNGTVPQLEFFNNDDADHFVLEFMCVDGTSSIMDAYEYDHGVWWGSEGMSQFKFPCNTTSIYSSLKNDEAQLYYKAYKLGIDSAE